MKDFRLQQVARIVLAFSAILIFIAGLMAIMGGEAVYTGWGFRGFPSVLAIPFLATGYFILNRLPRHGVGWAFLALGFNSSIQGILFEYMLYSLVLYPSQLPGGLQVAWLLESYWISIIFLVALVLILYPSGKLASPMWRKYIILLAGFILVVGIIMGVTPGNLESSFQSLENPYGWEVLRPYQKQLAASTGLVFLATLIIPIIHLVLRFMRAKGIERQQYKWFVYSAIILALAGFFMASSELLWMQSIFMLTFLLLPIALAVAVTRYRLFDIDVIIRRTLQYAILTGFIVLLYYGGIIVLQTALGSVAGRSDSPIVTVLTTLVIAALFNPLRRSVQAFIDRRFYRSRYDAEIALARFAYAAQNEVELDRFANILLGTVNDTVKPETVGLWLVGGDSKRVNSSGE